MDAQQAFDNAMDCGDFYEAAEIAKRLIAEKMAAKPERSNCFHCGSRLDGLAVALCLECQEESSKEAKDACERKDEDYE